MKNIYILFTLIVFTINVSAQRRPLQNIDKKLEPGTQNLNNSNLKTETRSNNDVEISDSQKSKKLKAPKATIDQYRVVTLERDTTYIDTSLTIRKDYIFNYLRKDNFGLLAFNNDGHTYQMLDFGYDKFSPFPEFGFKGKHFNYLQADDIKYYSVATPLTELYFKTTMKQGQSLDAFLTLNIHERLNFSVAYKGLRSLGKYVNNLSSSGNFRFTTNYQTTNSRYYVNMHITAQDMYNGENGGVVDLENFENKDGRYKDRARLTVFLPDAETLLDGNRYFVDHHFRVNKNDSENNLLIDHQFSYENKYFEYNQPTLVTNIITETGQRSLVRFGEAYIGSNIKDEARNNRMYNKAGVTYHNKTIGGFQFFVEDYRYNHYFDKILVFDDIVIPNKLSDRINTLGGKYLYQKNNWTGSFMYSNSISDQEMSNLDAKAQYTFGENNILLLQFQNISKIPDHVYNLYQSNYKHYNWYNNFNNEKINNFIAKADTEWGTATFQYSNLTDYLYFKPDASPEDQLFVSPAQFSGSINYLSLKVEKEFKVWKLALDNTILYQKSSENDNILNVPEIVTRNTLYFSDYFFKRALFLQTGFTINYFTKYNANEYNPLIGDFYVQNATKIGDFPMIDFFINARVRQTRIYLKAEHFNSSMTGNKFYSSPSYPYRDFLIRFGLVWNFFQ